MEEHPHPTGLQGSATQLFAGPLGKGRHGLLEVVQFQHFFAERARNDDLLEVRLASLQFPARYALQLPLGAG